MPSSLISQTAYAQMTDVGGADYGGGGRVTLLSTIAATIVSLMVAGPAAALMPWIMPHLYGNEFVGAEFPATLAVATGLLHMSAAPAAARLTVVSLSLTGIINGIWTILLVGLGTWLIPMGGAAEATASILAAYLFSAFAVLVTLLFLHAVPRELVVVSMPSFAGAVLLAGLGWLRSGSSHQLAVSAAMMAVTAALAWLSFQHGKNRSSARELTLRQFLAAVAGRTNP